MDLYPYSGLHVKSNLNIKGDLASEQQPYHDYEVTSGDLGFFDVAFSSIPPKQPNEIRILLVGGSGAQGWGARTNNDMLYKQLEQRLQSYLTPFGKKATVINLAMAGSITYQNYITLNLYGHLFEPDMILLYIGFNDYNMLMTSRSNAYFRFNVANGMTNLYKGTDVTWLTKTMSRIFPNIMGETIIGAVMRVIFVKDYIDTGYTEYALRTGSHYVDNKELFKLLIVPFLSQSLQSIKRDFQGIPMVVVWQTVNAAPQLEAELGTDWYNNWYGVLFILFAMI